MSGNRWDVMSIREYTDRTGVARTQWTRVGAGFTNQNGSINIILELVPCAIDGEIKLQLQVPLSKEEKEAKFGGGGQAMRQEHAGSYPQNEGTRGARPAPGQGFATPHQRQQQAAPQGNAQRYNNRPPPQQQVPQYAPAPGPQGPPWIFTGPDGVTYETSDPSQLPQDHPDHIPFD